ncbi:hypothetical protein OKW21_006611 [Catalinimonas alkaloidigena]|uniref:AbiJ-NTD4 domain-containing protein n=1 Tax=Catalinimonas alkaloidigena TaxID=1075417 RepID=UPI0024049811|nr:hypothetical protein [Catalinimonas alkaloidigena]MDF9801302.1 hypothetical protein [Catalinimonas alkaloidigena]
MENKGRKLTFGQRMGFEPINNKILVDNLSQRLRGDLYNFYYKYVFKPWELLSSPEKYLPENRNAYELLTSIHERMWEHYYGIALDEMPRYEYDYLKNVKDTIHSLQTPWYRVYQFFEDLIYWSTQYKFKDLIDDGFFQELENILVRNNSGYRFYKGQFIPITNPEEVNELKRMQQSTLDLELNNVKSHFEVALHMLSDKDNPDYRNSIKESISMVEAVVRLINPKENTLGQALKKLEDHMHINPQLKEGFTKIYAYTNSKEGIRHAMMEEKEIFMEDARYMLISCSAFTNYLIEKARKEGILGGE